MTHYSEGPNFINNHIATLFKSADSLLLKKQKDDLAIDLVKQFYHDAESYNHQITVIKSCLGSSDFLNSLDELFNSFTGHLNSLAQSAALIEDGVIEKEITSIADQYLFFLNKYREHGGVYHNASAYLKPINGDDVDSLNEIISEFSESFFVDIMSWSEIYESDNYSYDISCAHFVTSWEGMVAFYQKIKDKEIEYKGYMKLLVPDFSGSITQPSIVSQSRFVKEDSPYSNNIWEHASLIHIHQDYWASENEFSEGSGDEFGVGLDSPSCDDSDSSPDGSNSYYIDLESILFSVLTYRFHKTNNNIFFFTYVNDEGDPITPLMVARYVCDGYQDIFNNFEYPSIQDII